MMPIRSPLALSATAVFLLFFFPKALFSQKESLPGCGFDPLRTVSEQRRIDLFEKKLDGFFQKKGGAATAFSEKTAAPMVVPVVVHIVHDGGAENISDARVLAAIDNLNAAFAASGYFAQKGATVNAQIQFCLAKRDPDGSATTGITRDQSPLTDMVMETEDIALKDLNRWKPTDYVNIWVVKEITSQSAGAGVAGYAYFPSSHGGAHDGMVCEAAFFGKSPADDGVLIHEMGHYFGLYHTFEGGCKNDDCTADGDRVCDTPPDQAKHTGCQYNSCSTDMTPGSPFTSDVDDLTQNFLDYSPFSCYTSFTNGQAARMQAVLATARASLLSSKGCTDPCTIPIAAAFSAAPNPVAAGGTVVFTNNSTGATAFEWSLGGSPFSTAASPSLPFNTVGSFLILLKTTNSDANCADTATASIKVTCPVKAGFTASKAEALPNEPLDFLNTSTGGATVFEWSVNGAPVGTSANLNFAFPSPGYYLVLLQSSGPFCSDEASATIHIIDTTKNCNPTFYFQYGKKNAPDWGECAFQTADGGWLVGGSSGSPQVANLMKINGSGEMVWNKSYNVAGGSQVWQIVELADGNLLLGVLTNIGTSGQSTYLIKIQPDGSVIWSRRFPTAYLTRAGLLPMPDGGFIAVANEQPNATWFTVVKMDGNGNETWKKTYGYANNTNIIHEIQQADNGDLILAGYTNSDAIGGYDAFCFRLGPTGDLIWARQFGTQGNDSFYNCDVLPGGDLLFSGVTNNFSGTNPGLAIKTDAAGNLLWQRSFEHPSIGYHYVFDQAVLPDGYVFSVQDRSPGAVEKRIFFAKLDKDGTPLFTQAYEGAAGQSVLLRRLLGLPNGGLALVGTIEETTSQQVTDVFLMKTDPFGELSSDCPPVPHTPVHSQPALAETPCVPVAQPATATATATVAASDIVYERKAVCAVSCPETCDNGTDDDDDGLVDCFDPDCPCFETDTACTVDLLQTAISMKTAWDSPDSLVTPTAVPLVANLDPQNGDIPEIIVMGKSSGGQFARAALIFSGDGSDMNAPKTLEIASGGLFLDSPASMAIADLDADGIPELLACGSSGNICIYKNYDPGAVPPMTLWVVSAQKTAGWYGQISTADFDQDGRPEVFVGNEIFQLDLTNPMTPALTKALKGMGNAGQGASFSSTAADLLNVADCNGDPDCDGLELAAGGSIYSIDLSLADGDGLEIKEKRNLNLLDPAPGLYSDGVTAVADIDLDGRPEVLLSTLFASKTYGTVAWNKDGLLRFFPFENPSGNTLPTGGMPLVANVFDDTKAGFATDFPEVIVVGHDQIFCFNEHAAALDPLKPYWWALPIFENSSKTAATAFDFNGDGLTEIAYRDEHDLRIIYGGPAPFPAGVDGQRNWASLTCGSVTYQEYPVVADVDADGQAEIVVAGKQTAFLGGSGKELNRLRVFESDGLPWMPARPIWNQYNYFGLNINDDLTVPKTQQKHWLEMGGIGSGKRPFNAHLAQVADLNPLISNKLKVPDATLAVDSVRCDRDSFRLWLTACNLGSADLPAPWPIAFYKGDPAATAAPLLFAPLFFQKKLEKDSCQKLELVIPAAYGQPVFMVINDDGSTPRPLDFSQDTLSTGQPECHFENNPAQFLLENNPPPLDLGPDILLCENSVAVLTAGLGFQKYVWPDGSEGPTFTASGPGKYWVDAFDACGFKASDTLEITLNPLATLGLPADLTICAGDSVAVAATGLFDEYAWAPADSVGCPACAATPVFFKQSATLTLTARTGACIVSDSVRVEIVPAPTIEIIATDGDCDNPAALSVTATGIGPFSFLWSSGDAGAVTTTWLSGTYTVTATGSGGCTALDSAAVSAVLPFEAAIAPANNPSCHGLADGSFVMQITGGQWPFEFAWDGPGGSSGATLAPLLAGSYSFTVTDAAGCTDTLSATLADPPPVALSFLVQNGDCTTPAAITASAGGQQPVAFVWETGSAGPVLNASQSGTYAVTATDAGGCTAVDSAAVSIDLPFTAAIASATGPSCHGLADGSILLEITGGSGPFSINWSGPSPASGATPTGLLAGSYSATVTDGAGCSATLSAGLSEPPPLDVSFSKKDPLCAASLDGEATATASGGTPPLLFDWSSGAISATATSLGAGVFDLKITDKNGCSLTSSVELTAPPPILLDLKKTDANCPGDLGAIDATASGGTAPLAFEWSSGETTEGLTSTVPGTYALTATDANDCTASAQAEILTLGSPPALVLTADTLTCKKATAQISATASPSVGTSFSWAGPGGFSSGLPAPVVGGAGLYSITATEAAGGCTAVGSVAVGIDTAGPVAVVAAPFVEIPCDEVSAGLSAAGSSSGPGFLINWTTADGSILSGGQTLEAVAGDPGLYQLLIENLMNGCTASAPVEVVKSDGPADAEIEVDSTQCFGRSNGVIRVAAVAGGSPPFTYSIDNHTFTTDSVFKNLAAGSYLLTIKDAGGCLFQKAVVVFEPPFFSVDLTGDALVFAGQAAHLQATVEPPGFVPSLVFWSNSDIIAPGLPLEIDVAVFEETLFFIQIWDANGCADSATWLVRVDDEPEIFVPNSIRPGSAENGGFTLFADGSVARVRLMRVFDRWGELIFENKNFPPNDPSVGWDGRFRGKFLEPQVLVWMAEVEFLSGEVRLLKGGLTVVR